MDSQTTQSQFKRNIAYKLRIGQILKGTPTIQDERLQNVKINDIEIVRTNIIANIVDKFIQEGEKKYGSITLDDASGQLRAKVFGDDLIKIQDLNQGDTVMVIGLIRTWNNELYLTPEIIKKKTPDYLLIRKLETDLETPKPINKETLLQLKDKILEMIKKEEENEGIGVDKIILDLKESPEVINSEIKKLLEDGLIYEPRPGKLRYLG
jgi:RPA family protein